MAFFPPRLKRELVRGVAAHLIIVVRGFAGARQGAEGVQGLPVQCFPLDEEPFVEGRAPCYEQPLQ